MPVRSKWQSLPTEAINPATLAIDKQSAADIVEEMLTEDRKMLAAVQREKDRIVVGIDIITQALKKGGRVDAVRARGADEGETRGIQDHIRDVRSAHRTADLRRPHDCAGRRPRSD